MPRAQSKCDSLISAMQWRTKSEARDVGTVPSDRLECFPRFCTGGVEVGPVGTSGLGSASEGEAVSLMGGGEEEERRRMDGVLEC
ncbi:hypothetical protein N7517_010646 [Penicillium concentricum]|uniref:Uncharacterized protein n=1 Tax=Penicillium concentricum TaxID=293559 RepID=A0A9W9UST5_9EURO|nr:uncharacterized protein N7517_010646 [Penicillium concentricum]KAJ5356037.1 hypothetical protein N7517_010646 [Penicillium concentricum]